MRLVDDGLDLIEFDVHMLGIPIGNSQGQEVVALWRILSDDFSNNKVFYTDSNGLEMQKRILNHRETYTLDTDMKTSANYYPINSAIAVKNDVKESQLKQLTVMNDRAQGGSALQDGSVELMQNRRLFFDDDRGVIEVLNETDANG